MKDSRICLALDGLAHGPAIELVEKLGPGCFAVKGHDIFDAYGGSFVADLKKAGAQRVWVDFKFSDTPLTVAFRTRAWVRHGANILTVHAGGGIEMMVAAVDAATSECGDQLAQIWAVTLLTSLDDTDVERDFGRLAVPAKIVMNRALMAAEAGVHGIVCSALEVGMLSKHPKLSHMQFATPGTRFEGSDPGQQKRFSTHEQALSEGATFLVAASEVVKARDQLAAFGAMEAQVRMAFAA